MSCPSRIFSGYRALGYVSNNIPLVVRYVQIRREHLIVTVVGSSFYTYGSHKMRLLAISTPESEEINCLATDSNLIYVSRNNVIQAWKRGTELEHSYIGHDKLIHILYPFGAHLISVDEDSVLKLWEIQSEGNDSGNLVDEGPKPPDKADANRRTSFSPIELVLEMPFCNETFKISAVVHPATYVNKILLGSRQGSLQLWNLKTIKLIHNFKGWSSPVTVLEQAPAIDVIAIGLDDGRIIVHNLKYDETVMKFRQDWGCVTALSFRTDGHPVMASGSQQGHIALWNLEEKRLLTQMRNAHSSAVVGMKFLQSEPLMVTNSSDNSLKMWIFDVSDGSGRLHRLREGHSAPPTCIRLYGNDGKAILSAGEDSTLRCFSTVNDLLHRSLGQASFNRKAAKRQGLRNDRYKMLPITDFSAETTREKEWDNIVACHRDTAMVSLWSYGRSAMSEKKLHHNQEISNDKLALEIKPTCSAISSCGNFTIIGFENGYVEMFNMESGLFRGHYGTNKAHEGSVCGIAIDALNQATVTIGIDKLVKFWKFKSKELFHKIALDAIPSKCRLHRESGLLGVSLDTFEVLLLDMDTTRIVRKFEGHSSIITDFDFSADSRWLLSASLDSTIRTWNIPAGRLIDAFLVDDVCVSLSLSPTNEYLATVHVDNLGVYLWINRTIYHHVSLRPLPDDYEPRLLSLPGICIDAKTSSEGETGDDELETDFIFKSPEQISDELVTLSLLPDSRWKNLLSLDLIKQRNKPKEPPKVPKQAPFFLPTVPGLEFKLAIPEEEKLKQEGSKILSHKYSIRTEFTKALEEASSTMDFLNAMEIMMQLGPSAIELEIHSLSPEGGGSTLLVLNFMKMIDHVLRSNRYFEVTQAYLGLFLKIHGKDMASESSLSKFAETLVENQTASWERIQTMFNRCQCIVSYLKNAPI